MDVPTNSVVVTVTEGASDPSTDAITKLAHGFGDSVRIESQPADEAPQPAAWLVGGYQFLLPSGGLLGRVQHARRLQPQRRADGGALRDAGRVDQP